MPTSRFVVTSDVHIRTTENNYKSHERLAQLYQTAYAYSDAQTDYKNLDGIFFVGDITNNGTIDEYTYFFDYVKENTREGTLARAIFGNHESFDTGKTTDKSMKEKAPARFLEQSGYETMDATLNIGGYRFITLAIDQYKEIAKSFYSETKLNWLKQELDAAVAEDSTKPIFVFGHVHASDTVAGSNGKSADKELKALLDHYPQVIFFSGHTHMPITNARSVWQGGFTAINTGSLAYMSAAIPDYAENVNGGAQSSDREGSWSKMRVGDRNGVMYWIVETDQYDRVRLQIYNMETQSLWGQTYLVDSVNPSDFRYAGASKETSDQPVFPENTTLTPSTLTHKTIAFSIPQATSRDVVQSYRLELYQNNELKETEYRVACTFYGDATPETIMGSFGKLEPSTDYTIKVYAVNSWAKESAPLELKFTTKALGETMQPDVLNVSFHENGAAMNEVTGKQLTTFGSPEISFDEKLSKNVASFDGVDDGYSFETITAWYSTMEKGVSLETYVYLEEGTADTASYWAANHSDGGFGFRYQDGQMSFALSTNLYNYSTQNVEVPAGQWLHVVGTFDGEKIALYLNGQLASEKTVSGVLKQTDIAMRFFAVGANSGQHNQELSGWFNGKIADVKIYSADLSAAQIAQLYNSYN